MANKPVLISMFKASKMYGFYWVSMHYILSKLYSLNSSSCRDITQKVQIFQTTKIHLIVQSVLYNC